MLKTLLVSSISLFAVSQARADNFVHVGNVIAFINSSDLIRVLDIKKSEEITDPMFMYQASMPTQSILGAVNDNGIVAIVQEEKDPSYFPNQHNVNVRYYPIPSAPTTNWGFGIANDDHITKAYFQGDNLCVDTITAKPMYCGLYRP